MPESNPINPSGESEEIVRMTSYSHGAGCGCKLSPRILEDVLRQGETAETKPASLLVGNDSRDDAAVYDLGDGRGLISTTDFFLPIVDDPFDFGRIAATNAISDVYAMGGTPTLAIAILGWPIDKLPLRWRIGWWKEDGRSVPPPVSPWQEGTASTIRSPCSVLR
jgi:selenophosphate synthase